MAKYKSPNVYYRLGTTYAPGEVIEIPDNEPPSKDWERVGEKPATPPANQPQNQNGKPNQGNRPHDRNL